MSVNEGILLQICTSTSYCALIPHLSILLKSCVDENITMNFIQPFSTEDGEAFWKGLEKGVREGKIFVIVALEEAKREANMQEEHGEQGKEGKGREPVLPALLGCVILYLSQIPNAKHRGEVGKLMKIGKMLLDSMEEAARKQGLTLLCLDTQTGSGAEIFYERVGYTRVGVIPDVCLAPNGKAFTSCTFFYKKV